MIKVKRGLDIPITGAPEQRIHPGPDVKQVAVLGEDYVGMKPTMEVQQGDWVKRGQVLFSDKKTPGVVYTSPASGTVVAINRGPKRVLQSVVIERGREDKQQFASHRPGQLGTLDREVIVEQLVGSGLWTALRTRPYSKVPAPESAPAAIFVTAIDTSPLAPHPAVVLADQAEHFENGLTLLGKLTSGKLYLCTAPGAAIPGRDHDRVTLAEFSGPHPAGLAGTHIHLLEPVHQGKKVWTIGYQDVAAMGKLLTTGELPVERVISLAGPAVHQPRLISTHLGASTADIAANQLIDGDIRIVSGSPLYGRIASGPHAFLSRYTNQVTAMVEGRERVLSGWLRPGLNKHSVTGAFLSALLPWRKISFTTSSEGSARAMVPVGTYEKVLPLDMEPVYLLRSLIVNDTDKAVELGALELDEEDLALCTYVCPGKYNYGPILRQNLTMIEKES